MSEIITAKHTYNAGDLVCLMPGFRQLWRDTGRKVQIFQRLDFPAYFYDNQVNSTVDGKGNGVCMNRQLFYMLKPLIESQEYIHSMEVWEGQDVELDFDLTRDSKGIPMPFGTIHSWYEAVFPQMATDLSEPWLTVEQDSIKKEYYKDKIILNRTMRYQNPYITYYFLKPYEKQILFSGTNDEYDIFRSQFNLDIDKITVDNFYQLAQVISLCKFGIYNQSLHFHISDAIKSKRMIELCAQFPNTFVTGASGRQFYKQSSLEYYFKNLLNG